MIDTWLGILIWSIVGLILLVVLACFHLEEPPNTWRWIILFWAGPAVWVLVGVLALRDMRHRRKFKV